MEQVIMAIRIATQQLRLLYGRTGIINLLQTQYKTNGVIGLSFLLDNDIVTTDEMGAFLNTIANDEEVEKILWCLI